MASKNKGSRTIKVDYLARVEGEGGLTIRIKDKRVSEVLLNIFEPPRFFEALLRGRGYQEAPDITARICGICPVAYLMSACHAMEDACGVSVAGSLRELRRLLYCGEWIESHGLHVYMLHAPDFLGYAGAVEMAKDFPKEVERGLQLKKVGNDIVSLIGGRQIHPINIRVGGFYRAPTKNELLTLVEPLEKAREQAISTVRWVSSFVFPEFEQDYEFVSLVHESEYPLNEGRIVSSKGLNITAKDFEKVVVETHLPHSTSLHTKLNERGSYFVGPLARFNLNFDRLSPLVKDLAEEVGLCLPLKNPAKSIIVRGLEILYACEEALRIIKEYRPPEMAAVEVSPRQAVGYACTEAPRGLLYHRYEISQEGEILEAQIIPPTSQNQPTIEQDLRSLVEAEVDFSNQRLQEICERMIRHYDPCISCATHFLKLKVEEIG